ncbi:MAG: hypothetical protein J1E29_05185 [Duncaniella sp.]|nr:hypothetical protein [Duncaniella sp.]
MSVFRKHQAKENACESSAQQLYRVLSSSAESRSAFEHSMLGENMEVVNMLYIDYWKPRYLLNHNTQCAYEFMDGNAHLAGISDADIDWDSLTGISDEYLFRIKSYNALFPTHIGHFENGTAEVQWQINPDGRYWMDEDGYGMTPDVEFNIYGYIDAACRVIVPYQAIKDSDRRKEMRALAESIVAKRGVK